MTEEMKLAPKLELIRASQIDPKIVEWLWYPFIPYGKVTLVQGNPGDGKSTFMLTIAAMLTKGESLPFTEPGTPPEPTCVIDFTAKLFGLDLKEATEKKCLAEIVKIITQSRPIVIKNCVISIRIWKHVLKRA